MDLDFSDKAQAVQTLLAKMKAHQIKAGQSEAEFARSVGSSDALFKNLRNGSMPSIDRLHLIFQRLGERVIIGASDDLARLVKSEPYQTVQRLQGQFGSVVDNAKKLIPPLIPEDPTSDFAFIPKYNEHLSAGDGVFAGNDEPSELLPFSSNWLRQMGLTASSTMAVNIRGDSMEPTLADGDTVLIDQSRKSIVNGKVYAFNDVDGTSKVKRLQVTPEEFIIIRSDNPEHQALIRTGNDMEQVASGVIGQVVWSAHAWELNGS